MDKAQVLDDAAIRKALGHSDYYAVDFEDVLTAQRDADHAYYQQRITALETALGRHRLAIKLLGQWGRRQSRMSKRAAEARLRAEDLGHLNYSEYALREMELCGDAAALRGAPAKGAS